MIVWRAAPLALTIAESTCTEAIYKGEKLSDHAPITVENELVPEAGDGVYEEGQYPSKPDDLQAGSENGNSAESSLNI